MQGVLSSENDCNSNNISLHSAVREDNAEKLDYLLGQPNVDLNYRDKGVTALYVSLELRRSDSFIIRLIEAGCDPNLGTVNNDAPLHIAINRSTTIVALKLIEKGADVNAVNADNRTPLHYAVENNNLESVCILFYRGANVNFEDLNNKTPINIALSNESLEIISVLIGYYDTSELLLWLAMYRKRPNNVESKLMLDLINAGANVNCTDRYGGNLLECFVYYSNCELFKLVWSKFDNAILLKCKMPFLTRYIIDCNFPPSQWLECLYLILECPIGYDFIKHANNSWLIFCKLLEAFHMKGIEPNEMAAIIYLFLSAGCHIYQDYFRIVYRVYGFQEELEALIYCSSTNLNDYKAMGCSSNFPLIVKALKEEPSTKDVFEWLKYEIEMSYIYNDKTVTRKIANTLEFFWLPARMKAKLFDLFEGRCEFWGDISKILNEGITVPSLRELSRNQSRRYIRENFKIERTYQFYDLLKKLKLPQVIYDIICFKKPIYCISISQQL